MTTTTTEDTMTTTTDTIKARARIAKILAKANDPGCSEAERATFHAAAAKMMTALAITELDLPSPGGGDDIVAHDHWPNLGHGDRGGAAVVVVVARAFGGAAYVQPQQATPAWCRYRKGWRVVVYATERQHQDIKMWSDHLLTQLSIDLGRDNPRSWMSYSAGWAHLISKRLDAMFAESRPDLVADSVAVACRTADQVMRSEVDLTTGRASRCASDDSWGGAARGASASMPRRAIAGGSRLALGA